MSESSAGGDNGMTWRDFAACQGANPNLFYLYDDERTAAARPRIELGKRICRRCPVRDQCREEAFRIDDRYGVMGGLTPGERDALRDQRAKRQAEPAPARDDMVVDALVNGTVIPGASRIDIAHACVRLWQRGDVTMADLDRRFNVRLGSVRHWVTRARQGKPPVDPEWWAQQGDPYLAEVS